MLELNNSAATPIFASNVAEVFSLSTDTGMIGILRLKMPGRANKINADFGTGFAEALDHALAIPGLTGMILATGHKDFCVGADLDFLYQSRDPQAMFSMVTQLGSLFRKLETGPVPVVCALTGSALGGGYELALACHYRIALDSPKVQVGLPEVNLGVIPGGGGTQRLPRVIGIQKALENIAQAKILRVQEAFQTGMVNALAPTPEAVFQAALAWLAQKPSAKQPWDRDDFVWPGVDPKSELARNIFMAGCAMLYQKTAGVFPAAEVAISVVQQGASLVFDRAIEVEARAFAKLATSDQAKDMIRTLWFHKNAADKHEGLPALAAGESAGIQKVAILGAGMMGAGLGFLCASSGYTVVLKDIHADALARGMEHIRAEVARVVKRKGQAEGEKILSRITATLDNQDITQSDLVIEAVLENTQVKHQVNRELEPLLAKDAIWASNTSALPIGLLAESSAHKDRFIGLHFFSPVEKMPLLEIIAATHTSERTLARCLAFCQSIRKTPIVVNDGYGFFTTRVFAAYLMEGVALVAEGHDPALVEWAAKLAGMVVPPLQVFDEVTLRLGRHVLDQAVEFTGRDLPDARKILIGMVDENGRTGKADGKGFYTYQPSSRGGFKRGPIWEGLRPLAGSRLADPKSVPMLSRRLLLVQANEAARCFDSGVLREKRDAEVGAIFGIGFAPNTGGPLAWLDRQGIATVVAELEQLTLVYGERYAPAQVLKTMAEKGERFFS